MELSGCKRLIRGLLITAFALGIAGPAAHAKDFRINIPRRSESTPVQRLNREGVEAARKHDYEKARGLFYRAYLLDPDDPFTLNNLGFMAEIDGQVDRAQRFYALAAENSTNAVVDRASSSLVEGVPFKTALGGMRNTALEVNRANFQAIQLLSDSRALEADTLLQHTLKIDPQNPFTLNNMGVAKESEGDFEGAQRYYHAAAASHSNEPVIVTLNGASRGKPVSEIAEANSQRLSQRLKSDDAFKIKVDRLNFRGVQAVNRNDWDEAGKDFLEAYKIDPQNAFVLNNLGYLAEMQGDEETAQLFYQRAQIASDASARIGLATRLSATGMKLVDVAQESVRDVQAGIEQQQQARRRRPGPIVLRHRDNTPVIEPEQPPATPAQQPQASQPQQ